MEQQTNQADGQEYLQAVRTYFADDLFATEAVGIRIDEARPGFARVSMDIAPRHLNAKGGVMGGAMYTLGDFATSIADYVPGEMNASVDSAMHFISVPKGATLSAVATAERRGKTMGFYRVDILDEDGTLVASGSFTSFHRPL